MDEGQKAAAAAERRRFAARYVSGGVIIAGAGLLAMAKAVGSGALGSTLSILALALMVGGFFWGTFIYMKVIDEQERNANLWACASGMCVYFTLFSLRVLIEALNAAPPYGHEEIFMASVLITFGVFLWRRFR